MSIIPQLLPKKNLLTPIFSNIPDDLKQCPQWVVWKLLDDSKGKPTKVPYDARTGALASVTNPATWSPLVDAFRAYNTGLYSGVGFVLTASDPFVGIDIDHCVINGFVNTSARTLLNELNTYTEISPSGTGIRMFCKGKLPMAGRKNGNYEVYESARFLTVTGHVINRAPIMARQTELGSFHRTYIHKVSEDPNPGSRSTGSGNNLSDIEIINKGTNSKYNGAKFSSLMAGDWSGFPTQSEADLALMNLLAYWTNRDAIKINNIFRSSGLYRDRKIKNGRVTCSSHNMPKYINRTVEQAINGCRKGFETW